MNYRYLRYAKQSFSYNTGTKSKNPTHVSEIYTRRTLSFEKAWLYPESTNHGAKSASPTK